MSRSFVVTLLASIALGCAANPMGPTDAGQDAGDRPDAVVEFRDSGGPDEDASAGDAGVDAGPGDVDAGETDAGSMGTDAGPMEIDAGPAPMDAGTDAGPPPADAGAGGTCPALHVGDTVVLDGSGDLAAFPASQRLTAGGSVGTADEYGITWDRDYLYVALSSPVFADGSRPVHVYLEVRPTLAAPVAASGKEYDAQTAALPFSPTHLVAVRRTSTSGGVTYNGIYTPGGAWTAVARALLDGVDVFAEGTNALAFRVPWSVLGCASSIRLTAHVVNGPVAGNEWKDFVPLAARPWNPAEGPGTYYEIDLTADPAVTGWLER